MVSPLYGQRVYADTSALIYTLEARQLYPRLRTHFLDLLARGDLNLVTSWITFAEVLVKPLQTGNTVAEAGYRAFFVPSAHFEILPVDQVMSDWWPVTSGLSHVLLRIAKSCRAGKRHPAATKS